MVSDTKPEHLVHGERSETLAARYLSQKGLKLVARNYRCRGGEIDLIMDDQGVLTFVEVRSRTSTNFLTPEESITWRKRRCLLRAAKHYLLRTSQHDRACRFDVLTLRLGDDGRWKVRWIQNAFGDEA